MSNPNTCNNCNIQNSNPSYASSGGGQLNIPIVQPRRRYNPGVQLTTTPASTNQNTSNVVSSVVKVGFQGGYSDDSSSKQSGSSSASNTNLRTLEAVISAIGPVDSNIVQTETKKDKAKTSQVSQRKQELDDKDKEKRTVAVKRGRQAPSASVSAKKLEMKTEGKKKQRYRNPKTFGTVLASSPEYKLKFNSLQKDTIKKLTPVTTFKIPDSFDGTKIWKKFIYPVRNQGLCGSCWAFAAVFALSSRLSIYSNGKYKYKFAPAKLVFCSVTSPSEEEGLNSVKNQLLKGDPYDYSKSKKTIASFGCEGETLINTWQYLYRYGVPEESCFIYGDEENKDIELEVNLTITDVLESSCSDFTGQKYNQCPSSKKDMISHRAGGYYHIPGVKSTDPDKKSGSELDIRQDIYHWGPCTSGMAIYEDFIKWDGKGIYEWDKKSESLGGHAIVLMGWGEEKGKPYWIVRNSWGYDWGDDGYFKILRGSNHCEIEENVFVGFPSIPSVRLFIEQPILYQLEDFTYRYLWGVRDSGYKETSYQDLALGKVDDVKTKNLYSLESFPNFFNFIAGEIVERYEDSDEEEDEFCEREEKRNYLLYKMILIIILIFILFLI